MPDYAKLSIWAARAGLSLLLLMHLVNSAGLRYNNTFSKITIAVLLGATFPTRFDDPFKIRLIEIFKNTAIGLLFLAMSYGATISVFLFTEDVIPGVVRFLSDATWPSVWIVGFILFVIAANLDLLAIGSGLLNRIGFGQQDTEPT